MKLLFFLFSILVLFQSCQKCSTTCVAYYPDGVAMFETCGSDLCNEQINPANGEYCQCQ